MRTMTTPRLFDRLPPFTDRLLGKLLHYANSSPPDAWWESPKYRFYRMKDQILRRFGEHIGYDLQQIVLKCNRCGGSGLRRGDWGFPDACRKCNGGGIWRIDHHRLARWQLGGHVFHIPVESWRGDKPSGYEVTICGKVKHVSHGHKSAAACLWLALMFDRTLFRWLMVDQPQHRWSWRSPILMANFAVWWVRMLGRACKNMPRFARHRLERAGWIKEQDFPF